MLTKIKNWLADLVPDKYKVGVAIKKIVYMLGKMIAAFLAGKVASGYVTPDQALHIQVGITGAVGAIMEALHDYLKLKFPLVGWL